MVQKRQKHSEVSSLHRLQNKQVLRSMSETQYCRYRFALRCFPARRCTAAGWSVRLQRRESEEKQSSVTFPVLVTEA